MDYYDIAWQVADMLEGSTSAYLYTEPDVPDFTIKGKVNVVIQTQRKILKFELNEKNVEQVLGLLDWTVFSKDNLQILFTWNFKSLLTYFRFFVRKFVPPTVSVVDLQVIENFLNIDKTRPENFIEAVNRGKVISGFKTWKPIYKAIHLPLMFQVLPDLEIKPLIQEEVRKSLYAYYEIEGQTSGRMNALKKYHNGYLPYTLSPEQKQIIKPQNYMQFFLADYRAHEVYVLQWLSKDPALMEVIQSSQDVYVGLYKAVTGDNCDTEKKRNLTKKMFLPVMFGCGVKGLAANMGISEAGAKEILRRLTHRFAVSYEWMSDRQRHAEENGEAEDYFGRTRKLAQGEEYLARNFAVQGVAATFCQEKLIQLHMALGERIDAHLCFTVHDGYVGACTTDTAREVCQLIRSSLESVSEMCPGLAVKVRVSTGSKLNQLQEVLI